MKKKLPMKLLLLVVLLMPVMLFAQGNLTGTVKDKKGEPVAGASVTIRETGQGTMADENGKFSLAVSLKKAVIVEVSSAGFTSLSKSVNLESGSATVEFVLDVSSSSMGEVILTANSSKRIQQVIPMSVTRLNSEKIQQVKFNSQADILRSIPGITAEGGGGEVAANIFIRGLPSGGQYQLTPLQMDGMPIISTMGLNSSAPDVYFRNDLGISNIEFVRGGASTLYGMGSVAGIINYTSRTGSSIQRSMVEAEVASPGKVKLDFTTGGPMGNNLFYNVSGTYRYDNGPVVSGLASNGYQVRANIKKVTDHGSFTIYTQMIDDKVQFFLPYPLTSERKRPKGWDGETINTLQTDDIAKLSIKTPNGIYQSPGANGVYTKGGFLMAAFNHEFGNGWKFDARVRTAKYKHEFNFFSVDGSGRNPISQKTFVDSVAARPPVNALSYSFTNNNDGTTLNANSLILENSIIERQRPLSELASQFNITKSIYGDKVTHNINVGTFMSTTEADDFNVQLRYLSEFKDQPNVVNLRFVDGSNNPRNYTVNGVRSVAGYTNRSITSNKIAAFATDEIVMGRLRIDVGLRVETLKGNITAERSASSPNADGLSVAWGTGGFDKFSVRATDWAVALGTSYQLKQNLNVYANFSRGYFFPELRGLNVRYVGGLPAYPVYKTEKIVQGEVGVKYGGKRLTGTLAVFTNTLDDRLNVNFLNVGGSIQEIANVLSSKSTGVEATFDFEIVKFLHLDGAFTYQKGVYTKDDSNPANVGKWLERQPRLMFNTGLTYNNKKFFAGFHTDYYAKRYGNASNAVELDPYSIERLDFGYVFPLPNNASIRLSAGAFNLFNSEGITEGNPRAGNAQQNTGEFFVGRPIIPRSFFGRIAISF
jgi:iron complex outermembrane recepter protein